MGTTITELQARFTASAGGFLSEFRTVEDTLNSLPKLTEKATKKMTDSFNKVDTSIEKLDKSLEAAGDGFDVNKVKKGLQDAQKEFKETGSVSKTTIDNLKKDIKDVDFKQLPRDAQRAMTDINNSVKSVERQMNKLDDIKFLNDLPEDAKKAGAHLVELEKDIGRTKKALGSMDSGADFSDLDKSLAKAKQELRETGKVADTTMNNINQDIKKVDFDPISLSANETFNRVENRAEKLDRSLKEIGSGADLSGATRGISKDIDGATGAVGGLKGAFKGLGPVIGAALATVSITEFTKQVVNSTAEIKALNSQYEQVMGGMKDTTDKYLNEMATKYNVHPNELKKSMLQYQAILKSKGLSEQDAFETSKMWLERTVDGSAFANESMEESTGRMMAVIKGEYDSADTVMINLSQTMLNDKAQEVYGKKWEQLSVTQQENLKVQESLRQHNKAGVFGQGVKEADSYEKNLAQLKNTWKDLLASQGGPALAAANGALKGTVNILKGMAFWGQKIRGFFADLTGGKSVNILQKLGFSNGQANSIINWFNVLKQQLSIAQRAVSSFVMQGLGQIKKFFSGPDGQQLLQAVKNIGSVIGGVFKGILAVAKFVWPAVKYLIVSIWKNITGVISGAMQTIKGIIQVFSGLFTGDFRKMWEGIKNIFFGAVKLIWNGVQLLFYGKLLKGALGFAKLFAGGLKTMWGNIISFFKSFGSKLLNGVTGNFRSMYKSVNNIFGNLVRWLLNAVKNMVRNSINFYKNLWTNVVNIMNRLKGSLSGIWTTIKNASTNAAKFIRDKVGGFFSGMWKNISGLMTRMKSGLSNSWTTIKNTAVNAGKNLKEGFLNQFEKLRTGVNNIVKGVKDGVTGMKDSVIKNAKALANGLKDHALGGLNNMIDGVNWVADKLGMKKPLSRIKYSRGTDGHPEDGWATVGDRGPGNGKGTRELVQFPNGRTALFEKETTFWMPKGTHVYNNKQTEEILKPRKYSKGNVRDFAMGMLVKGVGNGIVTSNKVVGAKKTKKALDYAAEKGSEVEKVTRQGVAIAEDLLEYIGDPGKLVDLALKKFGVNFDAIKGIPGDFMQNMFQRIKKQAVSVVGGWLDEASGGNADGSEILGWPMTTKYSPNAPVPGYPTSFNGGRHYGIDLGIPAGTVIHAPTSGTVSEQSNYGGGVVARLLSGKIAQYFLHLSKVLKTGTVKQGDAIAKSGNSGNWTTGDHLHYQVESPAASELTNRNTLDPVKFLKGHGGGGGGGILKGVTAPGNISNWISSAIKRTGVPESWAPYLKTIAKYESGFNPAAVQHGYVDQNTGGNEARGLMQVTPQTYRGLMGTTDGMMNPINNITASIKWIKTRYGNITNIPGMASGSWRGGYANGGIIPRDSIYRGGEEGKEVVIPTVPKRRKRANELIALADRMVNGSNSTRYSKGTPKKKAKTHTVKWGDTLWDISRKNNMSVSQLMKLNNLKTSLIFPKQILKLSGYVNDLSKNIKSNTKAVSKKTTKPAPKTITKTVNKSRTDKLLEQANKYLARGTNNPEGKTSKDDIALGKLIIDKMKNAENQNLATLHGSLNSIISKIDSIIGSSNNKIKKANTNIVSLADKNRDAQYRLEALYQEKRLNGRKGTVAVKTRLPDADTTLVDRNIANTKTKKSNASKKIAELNAKLNKARAAAKKAKTSKDKNKINKDIAAMNKQLKSYKSIEAAANKSLGSLQKQRTALLNRYKVTYKQVKGRPAATLNKEIKKQQDAIANNKKLMAANKNEINLYKSQINGLNQLKKSEVLKRDFLKKLMNQRATLLKQMEALKEKETALQEDKKGFKDTVADNLRGFAGFAASKGNTSRDFVEFMKYRLDRVKKFSANLNKLKAMGLDPKILQEMVAGGIESAMPRAEVLISGGKGYIAQINKLESEINRIIGSVSGQQANNIFDPQISQVKKEMTANTTAQKKLDTQAQSYMTKKTPTKVTVPAPKPKPKPKPAAKKPTTKKPATKKPAAKKSATTYTIKWGDTLGGIAARFKTSVSKLKSFNGLKSDMIYAGRKLKIPGYATGGIVSTPQIAWLAEGGFAESIISHDPRRRTEQERIWKQTGDTLGFTGGDTEMLERIYNVLGDILDANRSYSGKPIQVNFDARGVGKTVAPYVDEAIAQKQINNKRGLARNGR